MFLHNWVLVAHFGQQYRWSDSTSSSSVGDIWRHMMSVCPSIVFSSHPFPHQEKTGERESTASGHCSLEINWWQKDAINPPYPCFPFPQGEGGSSTPFLPPYSLLPLIPLLLPFLFLPPPLGGRPWCKCQPPQLWTPCPPFPAQKEARGRAQPQVSGAREQVYPSRLIIGQDDLDAETFLLALQAQTGSPASLRSLHSPSQVRVCTNVFSIVIIFSLCNE